MRYLFFAFLAIFVLSIVVLTYNSIACNHVDYWLHRAQAAGSPAQVAESLTSYEIALTDGRYIEDKYLSIFKYPGSSMEIYKVAIDGLITRAEALVIQDPTDTSYQMGLVNL